MTHKQKTPKTVGFTTVKIKCRPLVKTFLENNYGKPVILPDNHIIMKYSCAQLDKRNNRENDVAEYSQELELSIGVNNFLRDGFNISDQNTRAFNTGVESYIKDLYRTALNSLLIAEDKHYNWMDKFEELLSIVKEKTPLEDRKTRARIRDLKKELKEWNIDLQTAIDIVVNDTLKVNYDVLPFDTIKKDFYRYRTSTLKKAS